MNLRYFIAARYVRSPKSHSVINLISGVSIVAMALPVAAIILLLSIFNGLESMVRDMYHALDADLTIHPREGTTFRIDDLRRDAVTSIEGVERLSFVLRQRAMVASGDRRTFAEVKGVDGDYLDVVPISERLLAGDFTLEDESGAHLVAAHGVMQDLDELRQTALGSTLSLYAINRTRISTLLPVGGYTRRDLPLSGIYSIDEDNRSLIITSLAAAQSLFNYPDRASAVELRLSEGADPVAVARDLERLLGEGFDVRTRDESNSIYRLHALEKWGVFAVAVLVMIVASLSIVGTLVMVYIDKEQDMRTLSTMGARPDLVRGIFLGEGHLMALLSLALGLVLGVSLTLAQQYFGFVGIDAPSLMVNAYPVELHSGDVLLTVVSYAIVSYIVINLTVRSVIRYKSTTR